MSDGEDLGKRLAAKMDRPVAWRGGPWTAEQLTPFTVDDTAKRAISNIFCVGQVAQQEAAPGFLGWIVQGQRPLAEKDGVLGYGAGGTVFPRYALAIEACVRTYEFSAAKGYQWFDENSRIYPDGKLRIFSVVAG